jgi:hypothetical protein
MAPGTIVSSSSRRAGVRRDTDALLAAHEAAFERFLAAVTEAAMCQRLWPLQVNAAVAAGLEFAVADPEAARLLTVEAVCQDPTLARRVLKSSDRLARLLSSGRRISPAASALPALTEKALVGATFSTVSPLLMRGESQHLLELRPRLVELILAPFVGTELARQVAL